jgi:hypothetical protein
MTVADIEERLELIRHYSSFDADTAHFREDDLWEDVLTAIAEGAANAQELARKALESRSIPFERWFS